MTRNWNWEEEASSAFKETFKVKFWKESATEYTLKTINQLKGSESLEQKKSTSMTAEEGDQR